MTSALKLLESVADSITHLKRSIIEGSRCRWDPQTRLDDYACREEAEPKGVRIESGDSAVLAPALPLSLSSRRSLVAVDGGSRSVDTPFAYTAVASVSIASRAAALVYPDVSGAAELELGAFVGLGLDVEEAPKGWAPPPYAATRSPVGVEYGPSYNRKQMVDEVRTSLETSALRWILEALEALKREALVVVDGPLYNAPRILKHAGGKEEYKKAWAKLIEERVKAVKELEASGAPVVGVVKRVERSTLLVRCEEFVRRASRALGIPAHAMGSDYALVSALVDAYESRGLRAPIYVTPIFRATASELGVADHVPGAPDKLFFYVACRSRQGLLVFRVEMTRKSYEILGGEKCRHLFSGELIATALPLPLIIADEASRRTAHSLASILAAMLRSRGIPLSYDTVSDLAAGA